MGKRNKARKRRARAAAAEKDKGMDHVTPHGAAVDEADTTEADADMALASEALTTPTEDPATLADETLTHASVEPTATTTTGPQTGAVDALEPSPSEASVPAPTAPPATREDVSSPPQPAGDAPASRAECAADHASPAPNAAADVPSGATAPPPTSSTANVRVHVSRDDLPSQRARHLPAEPAPAPRETVSPSGTATVATASVPVSGAPGIVLDDEMRRLEEHVVGMAQEVSGLIHKMQAALQRVSHLSLEHVRVYGMATHALADSVDGSLDVAESFVREVMGLRGELAHVDGLARNIHLIRVKVDALESLSRELQLL